jgi:ATP-binding cassette subfamily C protein CydCD
MYARLMADQVTVTATRTQLAAVAEAEPPEAASAAVSSNRRQAAMAQPLIPPPMPWVELWRRLLLLVQDWWWQLGITFICGVGHVTAVIGLGVVSALIVGQVARGVDYTTTLTTLGVLIPLSAVLHYLESWLAHDLAYRLLAEMRVRMYEVLDRLAPAYLYRRRSGDLVSLVTADVETVELFFAHTIAPGFVAVMVPVTVLAVLGYSAWPLAVVLLPFLLLVGSSPFLASRQQERLAHAMREQLGEVNAYTVDSIQGLKEIVAFTRGPGQLAALQAYGTQLHEVRRRFLNHLSFEHVLVEALMGAGGLVVMTLGAVLVARGHLAASTVPVLTLLAMASFVPVSEIARIGKELSDALASARRIFAVEDEPVTVQDGPGVPVTLSRNGVGVPVVSYEDVGFTYIPGDLPALRRVSFAVQRGQTVALVGRSGSGKTTAMHLLLRFWDPERGRIVLGGHDVRQYTLDTLRQHMALVSQDTYLFNASVRENLRLGCPEATDAALEQAAREAHAHEFIARLPEGYDTRLGERGVQLSGGQRQRLAIARAILKDAPILLLDEATSHLDSENERLVHEALKRLMAGRTTLLIAHRLSTVRDADLIVVLGEGCVVEQGTHAELLAQGGVYARLVARQEADSPSLTTESVSDVVTSEILP